MTENQAKEAAKRLKKIRMYLGYTQEEFADAIGKAQSHVSRIERGMNAMTIDMLMYIHHMNEDISLTWLITGAGEMVPAGRVSEPVVGYGADISGRVRLLEDRVSALESALKLLR